MHPLTQIEAFQVFGGYDYNFKDAILTSSIMSTLFGIIGAAGGAAWFLSYDDQTALATVVALNHGYPILTLHIALLAGLGAGGSLGSVLGLAAYYSGLVIPQDLSKNSNIACM